MKIVIDKKVLFLREFFKKHNFDFQQFDEDAIVNSTVLSADALFIRTRTICDEKLLKNSKVKFIATATVGTDHIDLEYCKKNNISVFNSKGCNSWSVVQYVLFSIFISLRNSNSTLSEKVVGIVGVGNVGGLLREVLNNVGVKCLLNDPFKKGSEFVTLDVIAAESDFVTIHTPYSEDGDNPTRNLLNKDFFLKLKKGSVVINAARGGIVEENELLRAVKNGQCSAILDCWSNEPEIGSELLKHAVVSTPHIAGYSEEGKNNATKIALKNFYNFYNLNHKSYLDHFLGIKSTQSFSDADFTTNIKILQETSRDLKKDYGKFVLMRNFYQLRHDFKQKTLENIITHSDLYKL